MRLIIHKFKTVGSSTSHNAIGQIVSDNRNAAQTMDSGRL